MTIAEMLNQSIILTLLGMCVVFSFLIILIVCMNVLRVIVHATKLDKEDPKTENSNGVSSTTDQNAIVAAIATALYEKK